MSDKTEPGPSRVTTPAEPAPRDTWYLATNQLNLMFMLAAGMLTGPRGFGRKYYRDPLCTAPGWIPLFAERIPPGALEQATAEGGQLTIVAAEVDLAALRGPVRSVPLNGRPTELCWPDQASGREQVLLVPAPLPASWVRSILFQTKQDREAFAEQADDYCNVPYRAYRRLTRATLFRPRPGPPWPIDADPPSASDSGADPSPHRVAAVGAMLALLVALGNRGEALASAAGLLADPADARSQPAGDDPLLIGLLGWAGGHDPGPAAEVQTRMIVRLLDAIVAAKVEADATLGNGRPWCAPDTHQAVLAALDEQRRGLTEPKWQQALTRLIADLDGLLGLADATVSELLQRHPRPFSRGLILFFVGSDCDALLALAGEQALLTERDLLVAAALFGARGGWIEVPQEVKALPGLSAAVTHRMAALAQRERHGGVDLGPAPARVRPLRELLQPGDAGWTRRQQAAALRLARDMGWQQALTTRISLGKGDYRLRVDGRGAHLLVDGDVKAVVTDVDPQALFDGLAAAAVPTTVEQAVRSLLG